MTKGERISHFVGNLEPRGSSSDDVRIADHPCYRGFFRCWNEQRYYEAHDVLEHLWLQTTSEDARYFKGLIQAAGAFVHLQKNFEHPTHAKYSRRLAPAVRLFDLARANLEPFAPRYHSFEVGDFLEQLLFFRDAVSVPEPTHNPWSPATAPLLQLQ